MPAQLFHFSDEAGIAVFVPRVVRVPAKRAPGAEWLNGPLVWAIDHWHQPMYLFPRDCPRILLWRLPSSTDEDAQQWLGESTARMVAHVEARWLERLRTASIERYELPHESFESLDDAGMWVSRRAVTPLRRETISDLPAELRDQNVELRVLESLAPLAGAWSSSLHVSGIRLRNAIGWQGLRLEE